MGGGDKGDRTPDLMTASHALSQLSYIPVGWCESYINRSARSCKPESAFVWIEDKNSSYTRVLEVKLSWRMRWHREMHRQCTIGRAREMNWGALLRNSGII